MKLFLKKLFLPALLVITALGVLGGCGGSDDAAHGDVPIVLLGMAGGEAETNLNLVRDMLSEAGFDVTINMQPDFASFSAQRDAGNFDLAIGGWTTVTGNPDYGVRPLFHSTGDSNFNNFSSERVDYLIDLAARQTPDEFIETYRLLEEYMVFENAYVVPLFRGIRTLGVNTAVLNLESVVMPQARSQFWELVDFNDPALRETRPVIKSQAASNLTSLDPIRGNDGSINQLNSNMYIRIINLDAVDNIVPDGSLSYQYMVAEGNQHFYFILRDDVYFATVEDMQAVNTGVRVGASDVVFSLDRARNPRSVPDHRTFSLHESMQDISIVTDMTTLDTIRCTSTGLTLREVFEQRTPTPITALTADKTAANSAQGTYQVVRVTTNFPFPQVLNYLAHQSAGIVSMEQVTRINDWAVDAFDINVHTIYGDQMNLTMGPTYDYHLWLSGPFVPIFRTDYNIFFERNPGYMFGTQWHPRVKNIDMRFIPSKDAEIAAFRSGEIDVLFFVPPDQFPLVTADPDHYLIVVPSHAHNYIFPNFSGVMGNKDLRLAVLNAINQDYILAFYQDVYFRASSPISSMVDTGNVIEADPDRVRYHLDRFWESQQD